MAAGGLPGSTILLMVRHDRRRGNTAGCCSEAPLPPAQAGERPQVAPELLLTARTLRGIWDELLWSLVEIEINVWDASNIRLHGKQARFPTRKTINEFDLVASSIPAQTWPYLCSLEWIGRRRKATLIGPGPARATP